MSAYYVSATKTGRISKVRCLDCAWQPGRADWADLANVLAVHATKCGVKA